MTYLFAPEVWHGDGFVLRSYDVGDGPRLTEAVNASYEHLAPFMDWAQPHQSEDESEQRCREFRGRYLLAQDFALAVLAPDQRTLLGGTGFMLRDQRWTLKQAEIGMWIRKSEAGRGLGTRVLVAMLQWGLTDWPWERIIWRCATGNLASNRIADKAGMHREGCLRQYRAAFAPEPRDVILYSALRHDFRGLT
jgi:RimJ/RimL family protein N-acetyltransferase